MNTAFCLFLLLTTGVVYGQGNPDRVWTGVTEKDIPAPISRKGWPSQYRVLHLNEEAMRQLLQQAPHEDRVKERGEGLVIALPLPQGGFARFRCVESPVMSPELAAKFPDIKTYAGQGLDDATFSTRLDLSPKGFHAAIHSLAGTVYIDPYPQQKALYLCYYKHHLPAPEKPFAEGPIK